jgi:YHS domain-containing protein
MPAKLAQPDDGLDELFDESGSSDNSGEMLDLDALVEAVELPVPQPADATPSDAATPVPVAAEQKKPAAAEIAESDGNDGSNPFTGIRLDDSDEETFDPSLSAGTAGNGTSSETTGSTAEVDFGQATNEFEASLPAINLPAVEDFQTSSDDTAATSADLGFPELDAADRAEAASNKTNTSSAQAFSKKPSGKVETEATPLRSMDTEKLQQVAEQDRLQRQRRQIQSRAGQAGFKGFCPVELRDRRELIDTNPEFTATFGLQTYSFSSAAAKTAFEADPSRYAPAAGGSDVVLLVNSGEEQPGMLDYALWYRDRLYLFRSRETMAMFNQDPLRFANQY